MRELGMILFTGPDRLYLDVARIGMAENDPRDAPFEV
jgi:hypothetical protein